VAVPLGDVARPFGDKTQKFRELVEPAIGTSARDGVMDLVDGLDTLTTHEPPRKTLRRSFWGKDCTTHRVVSKLAHPTRFERVTFAFGGPSPRERAESGLPIAEQRFH